MLGRLVALLIRVYTALGGVEAQWRFVEWRFGGAPAERAHHWRQFARLAIGAHLWCATCGARLSDELAALPFRPGYWRFRAWMDAADDGACPHHWPDPDSVVVGSWPLDPQGRPYPWACVEERRRAIRAATRPPPG